MQHREFEGLRPVVTFRLQPEARRVLQENCRWGEMGRLIEGYVIAGLKRDGLMNERSDNDRQTD